MINKTKRIKETYSLIRKLSNINGSNFKEILLDRIMYSSEALPPLGKEYWWFLFFGQNGKRPVQLMLMICRKYGKKILFNNKEMTLRTLGKNKFQAVTTGWIYDGKALHELGDENAIVKIQDKKIISEISGQKVIFSGGFPNYRLKIGDDVDLNIKKASHLREKDKEVYGVFIPPFGVGWTNIYSNVEGLVLGKKFKGTAHFQKVVGVGIFGPFHWARIVFQNNSVARFFCLKTGKDSKKYFQRSLTFYNHKNNEIIKFNNPKLKISKRKGNQLQWVIEGRDKDKDFRIVLEAYAQKEFTMKSNTSLVYLEYAVIVKEFKLKTKEQIITLHDLGKGVGTFEDAYW